MGGYHRGWIRVHMQGMYRGGGVGDIIGRSEADGGRYDGDGGRTAI